MFCGHILPHQLYADKIWIGEHASLFFAHRRVYLGAAFVIHYHSNSIHIYLMHQLINRSSSLICLLIRSQTNDSKDLLWVSHFHGALLCSFWLSLFSLTPSFRFVIGLSPDSPHSFWVFIISLNIRCYVFYYSLVIPTLCYFHLN